MDHSLKTQLPLHIDDLVIRRVKWTDATDLAEYWCDPDVARFQFWDAFTPEQVDYTIAEQVKLHVGDPGVGLVLVIERGGKVVGDCQLTITAIEGGQGEIGFTVNPRFGNQGIATRAVAVVLGFGFVHLGLHRIIGATDIRNERSWRLMERIGMRREAHFLHDCYSKGGYVDDYVYAMLDEEWRERHVDLLPIVSPT